MCIFLCRTGPPRRNEDENWRNRDSTSNSRGRTNNRSARPPQRGRGPGRPPPKPEDPQSIEVQVEDVIYHTFLPKILPSNLQEHLVEVEERLMEYVLSGITDSIKEADGFLQLEPSQTMFQRWKYIQPKWRSDGDEEHFALALGQELENQREGDTFPIYIRKQNCTLLITKLNEELTQLCTFTPMLRSETVMSSVGSLNAQFPQTCDFIYNKDLLMSNIFQYHIHQLAVEDFEISLPEILKGEAKYTDYRDVPDPLLVHMMIGTLVPAETTSTPERATQGHWRKLGNDLSIYAPEISPFQVNKIQKKVRDQVNCEMSAKAVPFRRSGMWMSLKATLMLKLIQDLGNDAQAHVVYKLVMLRTLSQICHDYFKERRDSLDLSLASQLIAKLGRRVDKLRQLPPLVQEDGDELSTTIQVMKEKCIDNCYSAVTSLKTEMSRIWKQVASTHPIIQPINRNLGEFELDLLQDIPWLDVQINTSIAKNKNYKEWSKRTRTENIQKADSLTKCADFKRSLHLKRYTTIDSIIKTNHAFNSQYSQIDDTLERVWIHDTEYFIKHVLDVNEIVDNTEDVQKLIVSYFKNAVPRYTTKKDVVGSSQMILVILKAIQILDVICTRYFPLLLEHNSGVKTCLFDKLLLPHNKDMLLLNELQDYFDNRNETACYPSLIKNNIFELGDSDEFSVRFARQDETMKETRERIWTDTKVAEKAKEEEFRKVKKECEKLDRELRELGGRCAATEVNDGRTHDNRKGNRCFDSINCRRCKINSILRFKRRSVKIYERPLPMPPSSTFVSDHLEYAVVFELKIPPEIALLRDTLALLNFEILGQPVFEGNQERRNESERPPPMDDWRKYMNGKGASNVYKSKGGSELNSVVLVTSRIASSQSNVTQINPDLLTAPIEKFIVYNGLDCVYFHEKPLWFPIIKNSRNISTFQINSTSQPDANKYENLQWTLESTSHSQNKVIASHIQCHRQLTPEEYIAFGSIRADGNRVQLSKLYHEISDRAISLHKEPVLALVLQTLWQVGPRNKNDKRESHEDFLRLEFSLEFLNLLEDLVYLCEGNYSEPLVLLIAIVITVRILEINPGERCKEACYTLLKTCRNVANGMVEKIERNLVTHVDKPGKHAEMSVNFLKDRLLEVTLCSLFSYNVGSEDLVKIVVQSKDDYVHWFHAISRLRQLTDEEQCHKSLSPFLQVLLNTAKCIPLKLELHRHLNSESNKDIILSSLHQFAYEKCPNVKDCILSTNTWTFYNEKDNPNLLFAGYEEKAISTSAKVKVRHYLSLDLIQGTFLVNGFPQSNLPAVILTHPLFKRYFKDSKFRIQRYSTRARTIDRFYGKHYDFELIVHQGEDADMFDVGSLIIREIQEEPNPHILDMIEPVLFRNIVGSSFVENYTHWLDAENKAIYFRRLPKEDADYRRPHDYTLARDEKGKWRFYDERQKKFLLSIHSLGFSLVSSALSRLEGKEEINVLLDERCGKVTAKLPRYQLSFDLINDRLHCVEFTNFRIAENQNMGTLVGLEQGLLLELGDKPDKYSKRMLIVPHGYLQVRLLQLKYHHNTFIDLDYLRQPSFFTYDYDAVLRQLKADKSQAAWLYLAALHATTSSPLPDPFTEVTGTERCIEIMKSGRVFPSQPYDKESLETLTMIRDLAPRRSYYSHGISFRGRDTCRFMDHNGQMKGPKEKMEITQWPDVIGCMAAYDGLALIVDKLIENGGRLIELHKGSFPPQKIQRPRHIIFTRDVGSESEKLQMRSYTRHLSMYNQTCFVPNEYCTDSSREELGTGENLELAIRKENANEGKCITDLLKVSRSRFVNTFEMKPVEQWKNEKVELHSFLYSMEKPIASLVYSNTAPTTLEGLPIQDLLNLDFVVNWLQLYAWAKDPSCGESHAFTMVLAALAFRGSAPVQQVMHLHHISLLAREVQFPEVPAFAHPQISTKEIGRQEKNSEETSDEDLIYLQDCNYISDEIQAILLTNMVPPNAAGVEENDEAVMEQHLNNVRGDAERIELELRKYWPCESISKKNAEVKNLFADSNIRFNDAMDGVNMKIGLWYRSVLLNDFLKRVETALNTVLADQVAQGKMEELEELYEKFQYSNFTEIDVRFTVRADEVQEINLSEMMTNLNRENIAEAQEIFESGHWGQDEEQKDVVKQRQLLADKIADLTKCLKQGVEGNDSDLQKKIIYLSGIAPRVTSTNFLRYLTDPALIEEETPFWIHTGAIAVLYTHLKRLNRCIALEKKGESAISDLIKEINNTGHKNWSPKERPEWLLLELELDIMIRFQQVIVAKRMMQMPDGNNGVMQLNMGEGKTSVIVPMLCASLASEDQVCRVTVLTSIFKTNLNILRFAIGGLLNRRIYTFPCRRNVQLTENTAEVMLSCLDECRKVKGVMLTVPEHRLSFSLFALDKILKKEIKLANWLLHIDNWLRYYCRDILDESDELLSVKNQLVYTIGSQKNIDGDSLRWTICQKVLQSVCDVAEELQERYENAIEFDPIKQASLPEQFTTFRLLNDDCLEEFKELVVEQLLDDFLKLDGLERTLVKIFMTEEMISEENHKMVMDNLVDKPELLQKVLLISAYLRREVMIIALRKRWRVEYGVNPIGERLMAVPFRAKDVAAERTEFGHPDLAIVLTHLSYYYSGLSYEQFRECIELLKNRLDGEEIYDDWVGENVPSNLRSFQRVNMSDSEQAEKLFEILRKHKKCIDFWLSHVVFPRESKQFSGKLVTTGCHLCHERNRHRITGFSGTNDSQDLLPLTIEQQDHPHLLETNKKVETDLLRPENKNHKGFKMGVTCEEILQEMRKDSLRILIDAGALMVDCNNEQVAELWLKVDENAQAAVYFLQNGEEMVKCRSDDTSREIADIRLEESPYKHELDKCVVFLDDHHTRGVDLKFPVGSRACVTVGSRMKREKLVQACMRMRKLEKEHTVTFYLSHEAHQNVNQGSDEIITKDVLKWTQQNTDNSNQDGLLSLSLNALNYAQTLVALDSFYYPAPYHHHAPSSSFPPLNSKEKLDTLVNQFGNDEVTTLLEMYGHYSKKQLLTEVIPIWFEITRKRLNGGARPVPQPVLANFDRIQREILQRCQTVCEDKTVFSSCTAHVIEEEQEKELEKEKEVEVEEEKEVQQPGPPTEFKPSLHPNVKLALLNGGDERLKRKPGILLLCEIFRNTTFWEEIQQNVRDWGGDVYVTEDFANVIQIRGVHKSTDEFLRPVQFVASWRNPINGQVKLLVISPFEVNEVMPGIRNCGGESMHIHAFSRRRFQSQDLLMDKVGLQLPIGRNSSKLLDKCSGALSSLFLASGNLYLSGDEEWNMFRQFLGKTRGNKKSEEIGAGDLRVVQAFNGDRTQIVRKILSCRHPVLSEVAHVMRLLNEN